MTTFHAPAPPSPSPSDYSILSSFDALSLSTYSSSSTRNEVASRRASSSSVRYIRPNPNPLASSSRASLSSPSDDYEIVIEPYPRHGNPQYRSSSLSLSAMEAFTSSSTTSASVNGVIAESFTSGAQAGGKLSKSAARRERRKKLEAGERERALAAAVETGIHSVEGNMDQVHETPRPNRTLPHSSPLQHHQTSPSKSSSSAAQLIVEDGHLPPGQRRRKTRRGGKQAKKRAEHAQQTRDDAEVDNELFAVDESETTSPRSAAETPVRVVVHRSKYSYSNRPSHIYDEDVDDDEEDEVDALSALESEIGTPVSLRTREMSVMSVEDATSSIDSFLSDPRNFMTIKANKLRLWQSLCVELGLVHMQNNNETEDLLDLPTVAPTPSRALDDSPSLPSPTKTKTSTGSRPDTHPLPQTLTQARKLLKDHAHVNLVDYLEARRLCPPAYVGAYQGLLHPSVSAMKRYTRKEGKFAVKGMVKVEWLEPLMRDFGIGKGA
ncbi:hypothetical protein IAR55_002214 [Kwoniella newhampshirensis]|uniref:Uncharacterized protein n=1 Tax=Kwoniella newhampshirensis TaxID=1651941 RepID=A0AAW0YQ98_9TREE